MMAIDEYVEVGVQVTEKEEASVIIAASARAQVSISEFFRYYLNTTPELTLAALVEMDRTKAKVERK